MSEVYPNREETPSHDENPDWRGDIDPETGNPIIPDYEENTQKTGAVILFSLTTGGFHKQMEEKKNQDAQDFFDDLLKEGKIGLDTYRNAKDQIRSTQRNVTVTLETGNEMIYDKDKE